MLSWWRKSTICLVIPLLGAAAPGLGSAVVPDHAVILQYHHVSDTTPPSTSVTPELFAQHLEFLEGHGFHVWSLPEVANHLKSGTALPDSVVAITFDDGYLSVFTEAYPLLRQRGWPFTVFVTAEAIDHQTGPVLSWDQLREMGADGATIASHGNRHEHLQRLGPGESREQWRSRTRFELAQSQNRIRDEVGQEQTLLAFPYGEYDDNLLEVVRQLGWTGFGQQSGPVGVLSDRACLPRFPMAAGFASMESFPVKVASLPLPVLLAEPQDLKLIFGPGSVIMGSEAPVLRLTLEPGNYQADQLAAYVGGVGQADLRWVDRDNGVVEIKAPGDLPPGRSRYNVTAPADDGRRWYWYSYTWISGNTHND